MMARSHGPGGALAFLVGAPLVMPTSYAVMLAPVAAVAALGPDIDHASAWLSVRVPWLSWLVRLVTTHRHETHSALSIPIVGALAIALTIWWAPLGWSLAVGTAVALGWSVHIVQDLITDRGVVFWWPWSRRRVFLLPKRLRITTNGLAEKVLRYIMWLSFIGFEFVRYWS